MTTTAATPRSATVTGRDPSAIVLGLHRGVIELKSFFREWDNVVFTFALPIVLLALLGSLFDGVYQGSTVTSAQYMVPSMIAAGVASATFVNLGISIAPTATTAPSSGCAVRRCRSRRTSSARSSW